MAEFSKIVTTNAGLALLTDAALSSGTITFTGIRTGSGTYDGTEDLKLMTSLKAQKQIFGITGVTKSGATVKVRSVLSNEGLVAGYNVTEIGLYARGENGTEILYGIITAVPGREDYFPPYTDAPTTVTIEIYLTIETGESVTFQATVIAGTYVSVEDFADHVGDTVRHVSESDRANWERIASTTEEGRVKVDGTTITISDGVISATVDQQLNPYSENAIANKAVVDFTQLMLEKGIKDVEIVPAAWYEDGTYEDYPFAADIPYTGSDRIESYAEVVFSPEQVLTGIFAPVCNSSNTAVTIYASEIPEDAIIIPFVKASVVGVLIR